MVCFSPRTVLSPVRAEGYEVSFWVAAVWEWEVQVHSTPKHRQAMTVECTHEGRREGVYEPGDRCNGAITEVLGWLKTSFMFLQMNFLASPVPGEG